MTSPISGPKEQNKQMNKIEQGKETRNKLTVGQRGGGRVIREGKRGRA